jgi:mannose-6-phosphate isomerase
LPIAFIFQKSIVFALFGMGAFALLMVGLWVVIPFHVPSGDVDARLFGDKSWRIMESPPLAQPLLQLLPNRARRNYGGGRILDEMQNLPHPADGIMPEDWLASTTPAVNPGMTPVENEGLGRAVDTAGNEHILATLFASNGDYYLGKKHMERHGPHLGYLAKLLDSSMRLHTQAHPTKEFARERMGKPWGKLESYVILATRPGVEGYLRLGFQHAPAKSEWREIVLTQDIARMDACFEPIPVRPGEAWLVPGGMPHALGPGLLLLEVMEPSDLVVRCEFEREGIQVPPDARYMGRDLDFCLDVFDYTQRTPAQIRDHCHLPPRTITAADTHEESILVPWTRTHCFEVRRLRVKKNFLWEQSAQARLLIVTSGEGELRCDNVTIPASPGTRLFLAAAAKSVEVSIAGNGPMDMLFCQAEGAVS